MNLIELTPENLREMAHESMLESRRNCMPQVEALIAAGWHFELPEIVNLKEGESSFRDTEPWQWYWRRPARRKGSNGMKFWSTQQAFKALTRTPQPAGTLL